MLTFKPLRRQGDELQDEASKEAETTIRGKDPTRQEFKSETDVNTILKKFGVGALTNSKPSDGQIIDYTLNLQDAFETVAQIREAHGNLPEALQAKYPTWQHMMRAAHSGELQKEFDAIKKSSNDAERQAAIDMQLAIDDAKLNAERTRRAKRAAQRELEGDPEPT